MKKKKKKNKKRRKKKKKKKKKTLAFSEEMDLPVLQYNEQFKPSI